MHVWGHSWSALLLLAAPLSTYAATLPNCQQGARTFTPCELAFDWKNGELPEGQSAFAGDLLTVEFRSPHADTYLIHAFWDGGNTLRVRFSPTQSGTWTYRLSSEIKRLDNQEGTFPASDSGSPGFVSVANVRHWWTTNKQPHLWLSATVPFLDLDPATFNTWLDARKHDGFTHVRGTLLQGKPFASSNQPDFSYFAKMDDCVAAAHARGLTTDLVIASDAFAASGAFSNWEQQQAIIRYLVARYGSYNVSWQGFEHFEEIPGARELLKNIGALLMKEDAYKHARTTGARVVSSPLLPDGWMDYLVEASPQPEVGAVEHQFAEASTIHLINATEPNAFRHELWTSTTNGEYPDVPFEALRNPANIQAIQVWVKIMADTRHWELEPYFDVDGARALGLNEVEYLAYADTPGIVEVTLPRHKYNPVWINPANGEELPLKNYRGEVFSQQMPDSSHDWVLQVPREGHKESMLKSYKFDSQDPPLQEAETDTAKIPFEVVQPAGSEIHVDSAVPFQIKITRANRASRAMQYVWEGEVVADGQGARVLAVGPKGTFTFPKSLINKSPATLSLRVLAINANGKAYSLDKVYALVP